MKRRAFFNLFFLLPFIGKLEASKGVFMITHPADTRGLANFGWLKSRHTFSFGEYFNPERMSFGTLRVINDDSVDAGAGFGTHPHRDMEIISIPLEGALKHKDSEGNSHEIRKGEVQIMSAGTGIAHSEHNASSSDQVKFLQIWVLPKKLGIKPRYEQKAFERKDNALTLVVSPTGEEGSVTINQDAYFSTLNLKAGNEQTYKKHLSENGLYIFVLSGEIKVDGKTFSARDGVGITDFETLNIQANKDAEVLLMEVPMLKQ